MNFHQIFLSDANIKNYYEGYKSDLYAESTDFIAFHTRDYMRHVMFDTTGRKEIIFYSSLKIHCIAYF